MKIGSVSLLAGAAAKPVLSRQDSGSRRGSSARGETAAIPLVAHPVRFLNARLHATITLRERLHPKACSL